MDTADLDAAVEPPGERFAQHVLRGRGAEGEDDDGGPPCLAGELDGLAHRTATVCAHLQRGIVTNQPARCTELDLLTRRNLLDQHRETSHPRAYFLAARTECVSVGNRLHPVYWLPQVSGHT